MNQYIKKVWVVENDSCLVNKGTNPMIPDGCLEIIIVQGNGINIRIKGSKFKCTEGVYLGGQLSGTVDLEVLPKTKIYFLKINSWISPLISNFPISEATNKVIPFSEINGSLARKLLPAQFSFNLERSIQIFNKEVEREGSANSNKETKIMLKSCTSLVDYTQVFGQSKSNLLSELKISSKTLENKFKRYVGLSPKQYANTIRLRQIIENLNYGIADSSLLAVSLDYGFFDQAHFIRSFKSLMGVPPTKLSIEKFFIPNSNEQFRYYTI